MSAACERKRKQCAKCPWRVDVDPHDIPGGYSEQLHAGLAETIAQPGDLRGSGGRVMACHETSPEKPLVCVGYVINQLGPGNNIAMRMQAMDGRFSGFETVGPQHMRFEDTLPKRRRRARRKP